MKKLALILLTFFLTSCEKEKKPEPVPLMKLQEGYIIGFDPCPYDVSHVIVTNNYKDTLVAYGLYGDSFINRLDTIYKFPDCFFITRTNDTAYHFPDYYYYDDPPYGFLFPDSVRNKYKIYLNYTYLNEDEKINFDCIPELFTYPFDKYVRDRQIKINYATKYPAEYVKVKYNMPL